MIRISHVRDRSAAPRSLGGRTRGSDDRDPDVDLGGDVAREALISEGFWRNRLGSDSNAVGRTLILDDVVFTVVGVLAADFQFVLPYDMLVIATGAQTSYFGHESEWAPHALGLKTLSDAVTARNRLFTAF